MVCALKHWVLSLGPMHTWSYIYLYLVGGFFYAIGAYLCIRAEMIDLKASQDRRMFFVMTASLILFAVVHGYFQLVLPYGTGAP